MKTTLITFTAIVTFTLTSLISLAQTAGSKLEMTIESSVVLLAMMEEEPNLQSFYDNSYGYAVFPKVTKGAFTVGAAAGNGVVYKNHKVVSTSKMKQLTLGLQVGGQQSGTVSWVLSD